MALFKVSKDVLIAACEEYLNDKAGRWDLYDYKLAELNSRVSKYGDCIQSVILDKEEFDTLCYYLLKESN